MNEETQKQAQEKYMELQMMQQQMKQVQQQVQQLDQQMSELASLVVSLDEFKGAKEGDEVLVPLSPGIFAKASLKSNKELLVNVGANTVVNKSIEDAQKLIKEQTEEVSNIHHQMMHQLQNISSVAEKTQEDLQKIIEENK